MKYCEACGASLDDDARFCHVCGAPVEEMDEINSLSEEKSDEVCPYCGAAVKTEEQVCPNCGRLIDRNSVPEEPKQTADGDNRGFSTAGVVLFVLTVLIFAASCAALLAHFIITERERGGSIDIEDIAVPILIALAVSIPPACLTHYLIKSVSPRNIFQKFIYGATFLQFWVFCGLIQFIIFAYKEFKDAPSSPTVEVEDKDGNRHVLTKVGAQWRDEKGNHWSTKDGNKFTKDD